ncbi:NAD-dependent epimerase/dehydratase (nucleoside-diphosphate-sugar epimerase) [Colletotrichum tofieldiae]|uniref:NAD-dependent epimerase/dehydratase (Nucleoside-diphosphate-sugar epimerase) n=1 Tax=Colletotrichum tofieldiae TaxID=708197 RepID=A0A161YDJ2_9PEZI|nr:NAD-dependent epimerase/dehydratase (nucleoside-diphosphate-sugar epimerase) [Colletotrichum tofieldiae]GKT88991.1 NAD-dependent epimerase/dehydratase [Colletotrichum tofieldiae]
MASEADHILITGAAGFIGQELITSLLLSSPSVHLTTTDITTPPIPPQSLPHASRTPHRGTVVVFPSSLAVYGPPVPGQVNTETTCAMPQSSYGAQKLMVETLLGDYSRRGLLDGRIVRLPTIIVRPGAPSAAASSFASGIVRESLKSEENILPVRPELAMWVCSPRTVVGNLVAVKDIPHDRFGPSRVVNLPGVTVTVAEILDALEAVGGMGARNRVREERNPQIEAIVESWPAFFDVSKALSLGLAQDGDLITTVKDFAERLRAGL